MRPSGHGAATSCAAYLMWFAIHPTRTRPWMSPWVYNGHRCLVYQAADLVLWMAQAAHLRHLLFHKLPSARSAQQQMASDGA